MKIICNPDCENSPKMELIKQLCIAMASVDEGKISEIITDDVTWNIVGEHQVKSKSNFIRALTETCDINLVKLKITSMVAHDKDAAVRGMFNLESGQVFAFSEFYEFVGSKINEIFLINFSKIIDWRSVTLF